MARRGRPKKPGPRYPGGQLKSESAGITATALQRLRALGTNPLLETQVGRLLFLEQLTLIEAQTAFRIAEIYGRYDRAIGKRRSAASPSYEAGRGRDPGLHESDSQRARSESAARQFGTLQAEMRLCPRGVKGPLEELCVEDRPCPPGWLPAVRIALDMLAVPLGIRRMRRGERHNLSKAGVQQEVRPWMPQTPGSSLERDAFMVALATVKPDIEPEEAAELFDQFKARYEREKFRADKAVLTSKSRKD